jgi:hypothetical protein
MVALYEDMSNEKMPRESMEVACCYFFEVLCLLDLLRMLSLRCNESEAWLIGDSFRLIEVVFGVLYKGC